MAGEVNVVVGNEMQGVDAGVQSTLEGLAGLTAILLRNGHDGVIPSPETYNLGGFETLLESLNNGLPSTKEVAALSQKVQDGLGSLAFETYLHDLGVMDTMYSLLPHPKTPKTRILRIIGFD